MIVFIIQVLQNKCIKIIQVYKYRKMESESINVKPSPQITQTIAKIDQLLRLYQMTKKTDFAKKPMVEKKVNQMVNAIKTDPTYPKIQQMLHRRIQLALDDVKPVMKLQRQVSSGSTIKSSSHNSMQKPPIVSDASISGNNNTSQQKSSSKVQSKPSIQTIQFNPASSSQVNSNNQSNNSIQNSSQISNDKSQDNGYLILLDNLLSICHQYSGKIQEILAFNQDLFTTIKQAQDNSMVYLFGVSNPQKKTVKKLYVCTLMKFSSNQITNSLDNNGQNKYQKQLKMFDNNLRTSIGLIMIGKSIQDISIEHIRFLADMKSPLGVIILLQSYKQRSGIVFEFSSQVLKMSKDLNKVQYEQKTLDIRKQYSSKYKPLQKLQIIKDKLVITKNLTRSITQSIESAQNAIQIQSSNECIKQEPNRFPYKLHTKYYVSSKSDYQLFFLDNQLLAFKMNYKQKQFDLFKKFVLQQAHQKGSFLLSTSVLKQTSQIKKQFFSLLIQAKKRDEYFLVNFSGITNKKTIILTLKQGVTEDMIANAPAFLFKDLEKSTDIINTVTVINKQNYKQFETESKVQVIDLTQKKK